MASVYRPTGSQNWHGRVQRNGRERRKSLRTRNRQVAERRLAKWVEQIDSTIWGDRQPITYTRMMADFMRHHFPNIKARTRTRYLTSMAVMQPYFGEMTLDEITRKELMDFERARRRQVSTNTIRRDLACLSSAFSEIIDAENLEIANPVLGFLRHRRKKGLRDSEPRTRYLIIDVEAGVNEEAELLKHCSPGVADHVVFAIETGLRMGEQWSLTWPQIDRARRLLYIEGSTSKTSKSREVPITDRALDVLERQVRHIARDEPDWVFRQPDGAKYTNRIRALHRAERKAGLKRLWWHDLRRTCGCRLLAKGYSLKEVSQWLGHASTAVTERSYAFVEIETLRRKAGIEMGQGTKGEKV